MHQPAEWPHPGDDFREQLFPWADPQQARCRIEQGYARMSELSCAWLLLARDVARQLPATLARLEHTAGYFAAAAAFVYENDSADRTGELLEAWQPASLPVHLVRETLARPKWPMVRSGDRGTDMAHYRNACRELLLAQGRPYDVVLVVDADLAGWSNDGLADTFSRYRPDPADSWHVVASNGLRNDHGRWVQADAWALRYRSWDPQPWPSVRGFVPARGEEPLVVKAAFGGLAVYRYDAYTDPGVYYEGGDCEHVTLHRRLHAAGYLRTYLNPSQLVVYRW